MPTISDAQSALERYFGFTNFREGQSAVIGSVLDGRDVVVVMPTGGGKSLCYQLPALLFPGTTLVISPLIALMKDQVDALNAREIPATYINSSLSFDELRARLQAMERGIYRLVYIAPERFRNARFIESLKPVEISLFAVDEAHCISQWGHDFRPDYLRLREAAEALGRPQIIALTATATPTVRSDIGMQLGLKNPVESVAGFDRHNLTLRVEPCKTERERINKAFQIARYANGPGIVYASTRKNVEEVTGQLQRLGLTVSGYHAGLVDEKRARIQDRFMAGDLQAIVATNAFGMGVDKSDLRFVTHYNLPGSIEAYYQEVGRAGRDGLPSVCTLLFNYVDTRTHEFFIEGSYPPRQIIERIYLFLLGLKLETIYFSAREISTKMGIKNEMAINSALIYLEKAGHIRRGQVGQVGQVGQGIGMIDSVPVGELRVDWGDLERREAADRRKLREMVNFAYHEKCLRAFILRYFGDRKQATHCRCSNCRPQMSWAEVATVESKRAASTSGPARETPTSPPPLIPPAPFGPRALSDGEHLAVRKILSCVARVEGRFGRGTVASVLRGSKAKNVIVNNLDELSTYGLLGDYSQDELTRFINALIVAGCIRQSGGAYPVVSLTELGRQVMLDRLRVSLDFDAVEADVGLDDEISLSLPKSGTYELTYDLYQRGLSINEIAAERGLKKKTIEEHIAELISDGREVDPDDLIDPEDRKLIETAALRCGLEKLKPIKEELPERIGYGEIKIVVAGLRKQRECEKEER
jgi:ATP-dependent DNA helicase RecQ